jgi:hypothetical protein
MITPLFKSHFSIGKSILTLDPPNESRDESSPDSVFDLISELDSDKVVLVEDSFMGFLQALKTCEGISKQLVFGVSLGFCQDLSLIEDPKKPGSIHKLIIFPKNASGCKDLNSIYTKAKTECEGILDINLLSSMWSEKNLSLAVPFYDSFIFRNIISFDALLVDFSFTTPTFFVEDNGLPFDNLIKDAVEKYCGVNGYPMEKTKSIYYKNKKDFPAYLTYKLICSRGSYSGRESSLEKPNMDHLGSDEFCWESYLEKCDT